MKVRRIDFSPDEWLQGTRRLDNATRGLYITACALIYSTGGPIDADDLRASCRDHGHAFKRQLNTLVSLGKVTLTDGMIDNKRCANELQNARKRSINASQNSAKRWKNNESDDAAGILTINHQNISPNGDISPPSAPPLGEGDDHHSPSSAKLNGAGRGSRLPDDWQPDLDDRDYAQRQGLDPNVVAEAFCDYWHAKAGADSRKRDWHATWRNWCRNEVTRSQRAGGNRRNTYGPITELYEGAHDAAANYIARHSDPDRNPAEQPSRPLLDRK